MVNFKRRLKMEHLVTNWLTIGQLDKKQMILFLDTALVGFIIELIPFYVFHW